MTHDQQRQARLDLVEAGRELVRLGLTAGESGNLSVRVGQTVWMSPTNSHLGALDPERLAAVGLDGTPIDGPAPSKEVLLHLALYRRDESATTVVHVHSPYAVALSCREPWADHCAIPPITPYFLMKVGQVPLIPYYAPGDPEQADRVESNSHAFSGALLANHGQITAGTTFTQSVNAAIEIEEAARTVLLQPDSRFNVLTEEQILDLTQRYRTPWRHHQPPSAR